MAKQLSASQRAKRARLARLTAEPAAPMKKPQLAITDVTAVAVREPASGTGYVLLWLKTDAGITGLGETTGSDPQAVQALRRHLIGQDALAAEAVGRRLAQAVEKESAGLLAAVNMALLDVMGQVTKVPLYEVLGGPTRTKARALANLREHPAAGRTEMLGQLWKAGFRAFAVPLDLEGGPTLPRRTRAMLDGLREALGSDADFVLDGKGRLTSAAAVGVARAVERFHVLFFDEPCGETSPAVLRKIGEETAVPLGVGHDALSVAAFQQWLAADVIDILRPNLSQLGITAIRKAAALAETYYVAVAPVHRAGPVTTAAALHLAASIPNFFIQEVPTPAAERDRQMRRELVAPAVESPRDGFFSLPTGPGLGVRLNPDAVAKYRIGAR
jgi:galactonate dehydratase